MIKNLLFTSLLVLTILSSCSTDNNTTDDSVSNDDDSPTEITEPTGAFPDFSIYGTPTGSTRKHEYRYIEGSQNFEITNIQDNATGEGLNFFLKLRDDSYCIIKREYDISTATIKNLITNQENVYVLTNNFTSTSWRYSGRYLLFRQSVTDSSSSVLNIYDTITNEWSFIFYELEHPFAADNHSLLNTRTELRLTDDYFIIITSTLNNIGHLVNVFDLNNKTFKGSILVSDTVYNDFGFLIDGNKGYYGIQGEFVELDFEQMTSSTQQAFMEEQPYFMKKSNNTIYYYDKENFELKSYDFQTNQKQSIDLDNIKNQVVNLSASGIEPTTLQPKFNLNYNIHKDRWLINYEIPNNSSGLEYKIYTVLVNWDEEIENVLVRDWSDTVVNEPGESIITY